MTDFLLKLCGVKVDGASHVTGAELVFRNQAWVGWLIAVGLVLGVLTFLSYWRDAREMVSKGKRRLLAALRIFFFLLLLLLLLRPVIAFSVETSIRRTLLTLTDASGSMKIQDPRFDPSDLKRAAIAKGQLDPRKGLEQPIDAAQAADVKLLPRVDVMRSMLRSEKLGLWAALQKELDLAHFQFGQTLSELPATPATEAGPPAPWLEKVEPAATATAVGDSVRELLNRKRGQALAGIFLVTDGASNYGSPPLEAAQFARQEGVPLFVYAVGITSPRDIIVSSLLTQEIAFVKDELAVTVRVRGQGLKGESARLVLQLVPLKGGAPETVAEKALTFADDEDLVLPLAFTPKEIGDYELRASVQPRNDEASKDNNSVSQRLRVIDSKVKALYVETAPRWEFRYLQSTLMRDRRMDAKFVLLEGDPSISEGPNSPYLAKIPATKEELFKFDLIILGDVAATAFTPEQMAALEDFVQKFGGAMLMIAGPRANPSGYAGTALEKLLPVELEPGTMQAQQSPTLATMPELTAQGRASPLLKLAESDAESADLWRRLTKLYWTARVLRAKPAAQVLLVDSDATRANRHGKQVLAAFHQYGLGQVFYLGTDNTWRWRKNQGDRLHTAFWGQLTQKLGLHHLLGGSKRTQITSDKQNYTTGERVTVYARLYGQDFSPVRAPVADASYVVRVGGTNGPRQDVALRSVPDQPGMYRGDFVALSPGIHQFSVKSDPSSTLEFNVTEPRYESGETAMNEPLLREMANASGGGFFREENLWQLPAMISSKAEKIKTTVDGELWTSPLFFLLLLIVGSVEWYLRKRWHLK